MSEMVATPSTKAEADKKPVHARSRYSLHVSQSFAAEAKNARSVDVKVTISPDVLSGIETAWALPSSRAKSSRELRAAIKNAVEDIFSRNFADEIGKVVAGYRVMLRESLATGEDPELQEALNRARLQEKILAATSMADQAEACQLLGLSRSNPSATMKRKEESRDILRFTMDGRAVYPLFQFDVEGRRVLPGMARLIAKKPRSWSDFRLLHWLTRPHLDFDGTPAEALKIDEDAVLAAFEREIEPAVHG